MKINQIITAKVYLKVGQFTGMLHLEIALLVFILFGFHCFCFFNFHETNINQNDLIENFHSVVESF